jgi:hypothetical protein
MPRQNERQKIARKRLTAPPIRAMLTHAKGEK